MLCGIVIQIAGISMKNKGGQIGHQNGHIKNYTTKKTPLRVFFFA